LFLKVMDTSQMQIEGEINQAESENFRIGQTATVGLDAFPGRTYKGRIASIGALAKAGGFQSGFVRKIPVRILIENSDDRVIPDLSAHADVVVTRTENATQIPRAAVFSEAGKPIVYVKKGEKYERRSVELGLRSNIDIAVLSGLSAGETVALQKPPSAN
jgi:hypothetical protein